MGYSVAIVVDREFGDRLPGLAARVHVWACASPHNRRFAETYWSEARKASAERGITMFDVADSDSAEDILLGVLSNVDLHHGNLSHTPAWDGLEVYGVSATPTIRQALAEHGVAEFVATPEGFRCSRCG